MKLDFNKLWRTFLCFICLILVCNALSLTLRKTEKTNLTTKTKYKSYTRIRRERMARRQEGPPMADSQGPPEAGHDEPPKVGGDPNSLPPSGRMAAVPAPTMILGKDYASKWMEMFSTGAKRPDTICNASTENIILKPKRKFPQQVEGQSGFLPKKKPNVNYIHFGSGDVAYLFDYLDPAFRDKIVNKFEQIWKKAKGSAPEQGIEDAYDLSKRLSYYYNTGGKSKINYDFLEVKTDFKKLGKTLKTFEPDINVDIMNDGVKIPQMGTIFKDFGMRYNPGLSGWQKKKLDEYDFNGDGTLDAEEFLFMVIFENKAHLHDPNLFGEICTTLIDPIFDFLDCDSDGLITAESIWVALRELKRPEPNKYDIYTCINPKSKQPMRTTAPNDFVLKNAEEAVGYVNIDEFRKGILLGYWDRQVSDNEIIKGDSKTNKEIRWLGTGETDRKCPGTF